MLYLLISWLAAPWIRRRSISANETPQHILLVQTAKIGDLILTSALIRSLKDSFPAARLTLWHSALTNPLAKLMPWVDHAESLEPRSLHGWRAKLRLAKRLNQMGVDAALVLSPSLPIVFALFWSNIPRRLAVLACHSGRTHRLLSRLLTRVVWHDPNTHIVDSQLRLVGLLGGDQLHRRKSLIQAPADSALKRTTLPSGTEYIGLGVSAGNKLKELGVEKLATVCRGLLKKTSATVVLIGGPNDRALADQVVCSVGAVVRLINTVGEWPLDELPRLLRGLRVYIGVDSGVTHMADAFSIPQVVIPGPVSAREIAPLTEHSQVLSIDLPCAPCATVFSTPRSCWVGTRACVHNLTAEKIVAAAVEITDVVGSEALVQRSVDHQELRK